MRVELQTLRHIPEAGRISRVFDKKRAAETRAGGAGERARGAAAAAAAATWKDRALRAIPAFGRRKADASRTHLVTSPVLISRRSCLST